MKSVVLRSHSLVLCFAVLLALAACDNGKDTEVGEESTTLSLQESTESAESSTEKTAGAETEFVIPEMTVEETNGAAAVSTSIGLSYTVSGYKDFYDGAFIFKSGLTFEFSPEAFSEKFNRFTMHYSATVPVHIYVTYANHSGEETVADFFVEKGEGSFSGLILDYLDKKTATSITKIVVDSCENKQGTFTLYHLSAERAEVYVGNFGSTKYYIENERFKLGVDMGWGGAICYLADLKCNVEGLENLVNKADEGRLIQQSYYGTNAIPGVYEPGEFNNAKWNYNPVQGGDKYGNDSRIIDIVVSDNSIYIKAQPQDWSLDGAITPSYMENTFILHEDYVEAKNRFVDFSGWTHPLTTQEIPAFYTVSYLDSFVWYDGMEPWSEDTLSYRYDLNFWGDPMYRDSCTFTLRQSNDETWCAWVNAEDNYGLGVYVPNADIFVAGRLSYNGSKDADAGNCSYVAPLKKIKLVSYEALEYSYLLTAGSVEEIRATFTEYKDFTANEGLDKNSVSSRLPDGDLDLAHIDFSKEEYCSLLTRHNSAIASFDPTVGALKAVVTDLDPYAAIDFMESQSVYNADDYTAIEIVYMVPTTNSLGSYSIELFLSTGDTVTAESGKSVVKSLISDGEYHTLTVDVSGLGYWSGKINEIRIDFFTASSVDDVLYIKSIDLK
ncbi:MAG: hypothetical protein IJY39_02980 [Clostridia bacterium]|nr:hypothetical protein [Clostridia bacterium]